MGYACDSGSSDSEAAAGDRMRRFVEGIDRLQATLFPECLEDGSMRTIRCG
jgi:hypothetical protein